MMITNTKILLPMVVGVLLGLQTLAAQAAPDSSVIQELSQRLDAMGKEINELRGENEKLNYELGRLRQNQKKGFMAIDERLDKAQSHAPARPQIKPQPAGSQPAVAQRAAPAAPAKPARPAKPVNTATKKAPPAQSATAKPKVAKPIARVSNKPTANNEKAAYNHAYETLKGNRDAGIQEFTVFLKQYPTSRLAENAHYWIGEAHYAKKNFRGAIDSFIVVLNKYKSGRKAPDAAVKLGYSFYALKDWTLARRTFNDVLRYFPNTNAAKLARTRLDRMQKEGH
jgi:tol-pal system protein YbgF